jgi:hypothetical protein
MQSESHTHGSTNNIIRTEEARTRLSALIRDSLAQDTPILIDALPSVGKSYGVVDWAKETGNPTTVFTIRTELYDQYRQWAKEAQLSFKRLPSFHNDCETASGEYGDDWKERVLEAYTQGLGPSEIHHSADKLFNKSLPCMGTCSYLSKRDFEPEDVDLILANFRFAYRDEYTEGRYVVFDEFPNDDFLNEFGAGEVASITRWFCAENEDFPADYKGDIDSASGNPSYKTRLLTWFSERNPVLRRDAASAISANSQKAHPEAAAIVYSLLTAKQLDNGWKYSDLPENRVSVISPEDESLTLLNRPKLDEAEGIIALDGTPSLMKWKLVLGPELTHKPLMTDAEKCHFLKSEIGINVVRTHGNTKPYLSGAYVVPKADVALLESIIARENSEVGLITSKRALRQYKDVGMPDGITGSMTYGAFRGSNKFAEVRVGAVIGSPHYGHQYVYKYAALSGLSVEWSGHGNELSYGEEADGLLHSMREHEVLQAILRFGRDGGGATVYVHTSAIPEWVDIIIANVNPYVWDSRGSTRGLVCETMREDISVEWRVSEMADEIGVSKHTARKHLNALCEWGLVDVRKEGNAHVYYVTKDEELLPTGYVNWEFPDKQ